MSLASRVSLYIPCYNGAAYLGNVIEAALSQSRPPDEILVIDDGSTDESFRVASSYPVRCIRHPKNLGLAAARNTGFRNSTGELVAALDADVVASSDWLRCLLEGLTESDVGAGGCMFEAHTETLADRWRSIMLGQNHGTEPAVNQHIYGCNSIWRRALFDRLDGYDERCRAAFEDTDFWLRARDLGENTRYIPTAICYHQRRDTVLSAILTCFGWRSPGYELNGTYSSPSKLATRWYVSISMEVDQALSIARQAGPELGCMTLFNILLHFLKDLAMFGERNSEEAPVVIRAGAGIVTMLAMIITPPNSFERQHLFEQLKSFVMQEPIFLEHEAHAYMELVFSYRGARPQEPLERIGVYDHEVSRPLGLIFPKAAGELRRLSHLTAALPEIRLF